METKKLTKTALAKQLNITPQAISMWVKGGEIPKASCIDLEPILKIKARKLYLNPELLFNMFNSNKKPNNKAIINE